MTCCDEHKKLKKLVRKQGACCARWRHVRPSGKRLINPMGGRECVQICPKNCPRLRDIFANSRNLGQRFLAISLLENSQRHRGPIDSRAGILAKLLFRSRSHSFLSLSRVVKLLVGSPKSSNIRNGICFEAWSICLETMSNINFSH